MTDTRQPVVAGELGTSKAAARIRAAAIEIFAAKGHGATGTREIAASLGLRPGAVYPHYKTKESLLFAISFEGHHAVLAAIRDAARGDAPAGERLTATVTAYVTWHAHNHAAARVLQYELRSLSPEHYAVIAACAVPRRDYSPGSSKPVPRQESSIPQTSMPPRSPSSLSVSTSVGGSPPNLLRPGRRGGAICRTRPMDGGIDWSGLIVRAVRRCGKVKEFRSRIS